MHIYNFSFVYLSDSQREDLNWFLPSGSLLKSQNWARFQSRSPMWIAGIQLIELTPAVFQRFLSAGRWAKERSWNSIPASQIWGVSIPSNVLMAVPDALPFLSYFHLRAILRVLKPVGTGMSISAYLLLSPNSVTPRPRPRNMLHFLKYSIFPLTSVPHIWIPPFQTIFTLFLSSKYHMPFKPFLEEKRSSSY